mmetsp:Transcript_1685/g.4140  ORF Transcript_1685/g.4140 Transcript_1685/m.4140 type:complete len:229 (+) Transcript_1685:647-1333(+)
MTLECFLRASRATSAGLSPASMRSANSPNFSAAMVFKTVLTMETFWADPTARNSNRAPPYGNGDVRFLSSAGTSNGRTSAVPRSRVFRPGSYLASEPFMKSSRYLVMSSPRYMEMMAGGASHAPRRKSFPGDEMAMRIKSPCSSTAATRAAMMTGKACSLPEASKQSSGLRTWTPSRVAMDQLLCFPEPLMSLNGFSCKRAASPCLGATSSMICMTITFWSIWVVLVP